MIRFDDGPGPGPGGGGSLAIGARASHAQDDCGPEGCGGVLVDPSPVSKAGALENIRKTVLGGCDFSKGTVCDID